jgi:hypothetical protein
MALLEVLFWVYVEMQRKPMQSIWQAQFFSRQPLVLADGRESFRPG